MSFTCESAWIVSIIQSTHSVSKIKFGHISSIVFNFKVIASNFKATKQTELKRDSKKNYKKKEFKIKIPQAVPFHCLSIPPQTHAFDEQTSPSVLSHEIVTHDAP